MYFLVSNKFFRHFYTIWAASLNSSRAVRSNWNKQANELKCFLIETSASSVSPSTATFVTLSRLSVLMSLTYSGKAVTTDILVESWCSPQFATVGVIGLDLPTNSLLCDLFYSQSRQQTREAKPPRTHKHTRYSQTHSTAASQLR